MSKSSNIKTKLSNFYDTAKESNKTARIISFFAGFIFNILGIIAVAVWKLIFSKSEEKNKYCVRLSILGLITKVVVCSKIFSFLLFSNVFADDEFYDNKLFHKNYKYKPVVSVFDSFGADFFQRHINVNKVVFNDFGKEVSRMNSRINRIFDEQSNLFRTMFNSGIAEHKSINKEMGRSEELETVKQHRQATRDVFSNFEREIIKMQQDVNRIFNEQQKVFEDIFNNGRKEHKKINIKLGQNRDNNQKDLKVKKEVKTENGFETTTIEKTSPYGYSQQTTIKYVGDNGKQKKEELNNKQEVIKLQQIKHNSKKQNNRSGKNSKKTN